MKSNSEFQLVLWLVRHGETDFNKNRCIQGHKDIELNQTGEEQAKRVVSVLCHQFKDTPAQHLIHPIMYSSDLKRAHKTALIFQQVFAQNLNWNLTVQTMYGLRERYFGDLEGKPYGTSNSKLYSSTISKTKEEEEDNSDHEDDHDETNASINSFQTRRDKEPESLEGLQARVVETILKIAKQHHASATTANNVFLFMHGGSIKALLCWALGLSFDSMKKFRIDNLAISKLDVHFRWDENQELICTQQHVSQVNWCTNLVGINANV